MDTGNYMANQMDDLITNGLKQKDELEIAKQKMKDYRDLFGNELTRKDLIDEAKNIIDLDSILNTESAPIFNKRGFLSKRSNGKLIRIPYHPCHPYPYH